MGYFITFNEDGFVNGIFNTELESTDNHKEIFMVTEQVRDEIANYPYKDIMRVDNLTDTTKLYSNASDLIAKNTTIEIVVVEEQVDQEKLAMAEAIADLYEQLLILQGGV